MHNYCWLTFGINSRWTPQLIELSKHKNVSSYFSFIDIELTFHAVAAESHSLQILWAWHIVVLHIFWYVLLQGMLCACKIWCFYLTFPACALAELVDNALSATAKNTDVRRIEIRMVSYAICLQWACLNLVPFYISYVYSDFLTCSFICSPAVWQSFWETCSYCFG